MAKNFVLKQNGMKTYSRITDLSYFLETGAEKEAFYNKDSDIIRAIVDNPDVSDVTLDLLMYDCVSRDGVNKFDDPDYIYGTRITYKINIGKGYTATCEYRWQSLPRDRKHAPDIRKEQFLCEIYQSRLFVGRNNLPIRKALYGPFNSIPVDLRKLIKSR